MVGDHILPDDLDDLTEIESTRLGLPQELQHISSLRVAQALAVKMAEATDGLVFPHLQFTYPGAGVIGRGTVRVSPSEALP